ncbi:MAG: glycoside hydrolase family 95 protein [Defluviitaleaceae bacterium]|nr:glycoside hydrolase family 95 protein [Defluviitaleaceae bacterium]
MHTLRYDQEAKTWEEALPLGNGRIGAMVWSGMASERLSLNEDTLWSGYPQNHAMPEAYEGFITAQELAMDGKYNEAQALIETKMLGPYTQGYLPMGELLLEMEGHDPESISDYQRVLDIEKALNILKYRKNGVSYTRESFISFPDQALLMKISGDKPKSVSLSAHITCQLRYKISTDGNQLALEGIAPSNARPIYHMTDDPIIYDDTPGKQGLSFLTLVDFEAVNGEVKAEDGRLLIKDADEVIIRLCCRTSFTEPSLYWTICENDLKKALTLDYQNLKARHIEDYQDLYNRVEISFGQEANQLLPLPQLLDRWEQSEKIPELFALLFQYGRYLMIAGSRPGTTPLNLQGIWNPHLHPPWSSNYTININTEMNYWPAEVANLSECHQPLFDLLDQLRITGAETARKFYNAGGFTVHHNTDLWGHSTPVGEGGEGTAVYAFWPMAAGWLSAHVFEHYLYTQDKVFLRERVLPILRDAARFYLDVLIEDADGTLIFAPSTSPENTFKYKGKNSAVSKTATMTTAIIRETLSNLVYCCNALGGYSDIKDEALAALKRLPDYQTGSRGELLEWNEALPEHEPDHRHTSHLYPLHPGREIKPGTALANACARTLALRGGEGTGWALAWRVNLWARLQEAEKAFDCLKKQLRPATETIGGCYPNLFGAHPPFQIDSNFGACAGIAELLLQSNVDSEGLQPNEIILLPALPKALGTGYVKGLRARGGVTVAISFENGELIKAELVLDPHLSAQKFVIIHKKQTLNVDLGPGEIYNYKELI